MSKSKKADKWAKLDGGSHESPKKGSKGKNRPQSEPRRGIPAAALDPKRAYLL